jgi:hypothetical protein
MRSWSLARFMQEPLSRAAGLEVQPCRAQRSPVVQPTSKVCYLACPGMSGAVALSTSSANFRWLASSCSAKS